MTTERIIQDEPPEIRPRGTTSGTLSSDLRRMNVGQWMQFADVETVAKEGINVVRNRPGSTIAYVRRQTGATFITRTAVDGSLWIGRTS